MARNDTTQAAVNTARSNLTSSVFTYATSTLPPLHDAIASSVLAMDPNHPQMAGLPAKYDRLYRAFVQFVNESIADGTYAGKPLRYP
jgi:hypothetical protein